MAAETDHALSRRRHHRNKTIKHFAFRVGKFSLKSCYWISIFASLLVVAFVSAVRWVVLPRLSDYQDSIVSRVALATGMDVSAQSIRGRWRGFRPYVDMQEVVFREPASATRREAGAEALRLPFVSASLSWWALAMGQIRFGEIAIDGPKLTLSRREDGLIYFAGRALNEAKPVEDDGRLLQWLLDQEGLVVQGATLSWNDALTPGQELSFGDVGIAVHKRRNGHEFGLVARPLVPVAQWIDVRGAVKVANETGKWQGSGSVYANVVGARLNDIRQHVNVPDALLAGGGNLRAWFDFDTAAPMLAVPNAAMRASTPLRAITADLKLTDTRVRLADDLAPLDFADLTGRIEYRASDAGFTMASKGLAFRTANGVQLPPADFSLMLANQNDAATMNGEMKGNGIDLKVLTALLEYFPVGKDVRQVANAFAPRGNIQDTRFAWRGPLEAPSSFSVKGKLADFAIQKRGDEPAVSGFTGSLDGNEKEGRFEIASKALALDLPRLYEDPIAFDTLEAKGTWKIDADRIDVGIAKLAFQNADLAGEFKGDYWRYRASGSKAAEEKGPGSIDLTGRFDRIKAAAVGSFLPRSAVNVRKYLEWAIRSGEIKNADLVLKGSLYDFPFRHGQGGQFRIAGNMDQLALRHNEGWPQISAIDGPVLWENTRFEATVKTATVLSSKLGETTVAIDDVGALPAMLSVKGGANARAEEVSRYLRESPLIETVGGFTRYVAIEGPGKLELDMSIPLGDAQQHKVPLRLSGRYALNKGRATVSVGDKRVDIGNLGGSVSFSESATRSNGLNGIAFGQPLTLHIATNAEGGVTTEFAGKGALSQIGELMPFRLPQQVSGTIEYAGRVIGRGKAVDIQFGSSLIGAVSTLPFPLAKRADEPRALNVVFADAGQASETIRVSVAGNAGSAAGPAENVASRVEAQFKRRLEGATPSGGFFGGIAVVGEPFGSRAIPEGMWLVGKLARFDFDAWRDAVERFYPPQAAGSASTPGNESPIAGFDFKLNEMVAYGRPFRALTLKGRHAGEDWRLNVDSEEAVGDFSWRPGSGIDKGYVRARLKRFALAEEVPTNAKPVVQTVAGQQVEADRTELPAFDIVADEFRYKGYFLGKLDFKATPQGANWKIDRLDVTNGHAKLTTDGIYQRYGDPMKPDGRARTSLNVKLDSVNYNAIMDQFGYADYLHGGRGTVEGKLNWPGHAFQFSFATLSGDLKIGLQEGRFSKVEPGAGKLLGLLSLQSLPNRLALDFRDVYAEGLAFNKIDSDVKIINGVMSTDRLAIAGPAVYIELKGDVTLPTETVNLKARVLPSVGVAPSLWAVVLNPVIGVGVFAASKLFEQALSYELTITGTWDKPQVQDLRKNPPKETVLPPVSSTPPAGEGKKSP
jgi:uncharacterized protein (TIGR02099 family)